MKIDRVVFSCTETFSVFWNLASKIYATKLGIFPVCLLFGKRHNTDMTQEYGQIFEWEIMPEYPLLPQLMWSKFFHVWYNPQATHLIGDIDLLPLSPRWFNDRIKDIPEDHYVHLDADGICQLSGTKFNWANKIIDHTNTRHDGHYTNMPGHYHCGRGDVLAQALELSPSFRQEIDHIVNSGLYNNTRGERIDDPIEQANLWCAEEHRSTTAIRRSVLAGKTKFTGLSLRNGVDGIGGIDGDRIDRTVYDDATATYRCNLSRLQNGDYADLHCVRPFAHFLDINQQRRRWAATEWALRLAGMI